MSDLQTDNRRWYAAAIVVSTLLFVGMLWGLWPTEQAAVATPVAPTAAPAVTVITVAPKPSSLDSVKGTDSSVSPDTLRLQLFSTAPGKTPHEGTAVLGADPVNPQTYAAGSVLASGAIIEEIHRDYVLLRHRGHRSKLFRVGLTAEPDEALLAATTVGGPGIADRQIETHASSQEDYVDFVKAKLVFEDDKVSGFEIAAGRQSYKLSDLGLAQGDVIRSIDGHPVAADADWQRIVKAIRSGGSVALGIEREGSLLSVMLDASRLGANSSHGLADVSTPLPPPRS